MDGNPIKLKDVYRNPIDDKDLVKIWALLNKEVGVQTRKNLHASGRMPGGSWRRGRGGSWKGGKTKKRNRRNRKSRKIARK